MFGTRQRRHGALLATVVGLACAATPRAARAVGNEGEPDAIGKGIVGGALLGAELTLAVEAIVGVRPWWGYLIGGTLGAAAGGVGGFFVADAAGPEVPTAFLVSGLVLAVPTTIFVLNQTRFRPPEDETVTARAELRVAPRETPVASVPSLFETKATGQLGLGFPRVDVGQGRVETVPFSAGYRPTSTPQGTFVQVPILNLRFH